MYKKVYCYSALSLFVLFAMNASQQEVMKQEKQPTISAVERTLAIIKPGAVKDGHADAIIAIIKENGFAVVDRRDFTLSRDQAEHFYGDLKGKSFFGDLVKMMTSGPVVMLVLEKVGAIQAWRELMGTTNPAQAADGTIRKLYGKDKGANAVHGSDSRESAAKELSYFFPHLCAKL